MTHYTPPPPFEEGLHVSPYELFRRLVEGERLSLLDLRATGTTLVGALRGQPMSSLPPGTILIDLRYRNPTLNLLRPA